MNEWKKGVAYTYNMSINTYRHMHIYAHIYKLEYYLTTIKERNHAIYNI